MIQRGLFRPELPRAAYPGEPPLWIKRLVILRRKSPVPETIQDVEFRLGLNIINTRNDPTADATAAGHDVGKTLLVRLVRYCLGDDHFASPTVRGRIRVRFPEAWVIAIVQVSGGTWGVMRPLAPGPPSFCLLTESWQEMLHDPAGLRPYAEFQDALNQLVPAEFNQVRLDQHNRCPGWTDLLGWLVRDQRCRYTHHNLWRHKEAESGPGVLLPTEANLITRLMTGLFDQAEHRLTERLAEQRAELQRLETQLRDLRSEAEQARTRLLTIAPLDGDPPAGPLFPDLRARIEAQVASQERLLADPGLRQRLDQAEQVLQDSRDVLNRLIGRLEELARQHELASRQLQAASQPSEPEILAQEQRRLSCGHPQCYWLTNAQPGLPDPLRADRIRDYTLRTEELQREMAATTATRDQQAAAVREATDRYHRERSEYRTATEGIRRLIARYNWMAEQLTALEAGRAQIEQLERQIPAMRNEEARLERQREARSRRRADGVRELNSIFRYVTTALLGREAGGLVLNLSVGLAPRADEASGEACGTAGTVIGFDLTCLVASVCGRGRHPRFLIHDSPREADMHDLIYRNLFLLIRSLEEHFPGQPPAFQYIITTTTPPPSEVLSEPYIRLTLCAQPVEGRLLAMGF